MDRTSGGKVIWKVDSISVKIMLLAYSHRVSLNHLIRLEDTEQANR